MKTIGLIGGMSWESSLGILSDYKRTCQKKPGGLNSAKILIYL